MGIDPAVAGSWYYLSRLILSRLRHPSVYPSKAPYISLAALLEPVLHDSLGFILIQSLQQFLTRPFLRPLLQSPFLSLHLRALATVVHQHGDLPRLLARTQASIAELSPLTNLVVRVLLVSHTVLRAVPVVGGKAPADEHAVGVGIVEPVDTHARGAASLSDAEDVTIFGEVFVDVVGASLLAVYGFAAAKEDGELEGTHLGGWWLRR